MRKLCLQERNMQYDYKFYTSKEIIMEKDYKNVN